jgi:hypothetical protein
MAGKLPVCRILFGSDSRALILVISGYYIIYENHDVLDIT